MTSSPGSPEDDMATTTPSGPIRVNGGAAVHWGTQYGPACGAGFNRRGGVPTVKAAPGQPVTCTRKACAAHAEGGQQ